jgi:hypothetical protein
MLRRFVAGVVDFVVGDDWILAAGVVVTLLLGWFVGRAVASWWVILLGVAITLGVSLARATRRG